jgi:hypothetical protein
MYILPEDQYKSARSRLGGNIGEAEAFTSNQTGATLKDLANVLQSPSRMGALQAAKPSNPTMYFNRDSPQSMGDMGHEVAHAISQHGMYPADNQVLTALAKYSPLGQSNLKRAGYPDVSQQASEVIARLMSPSETYGMGVSDKDAPQLFQDYLKLVQDPKQRAQFQANWLTKHPQLDPAKRNTDVNQQQPSTTF